MRPDYVLNEHGVPVRNPEAFRGKQPQGGSASNGQAQPNESRPWLAIMWKCCSVYSRVYRNADGKAYEGRCPKCSKQVKIPVGQGGTSHRFFEAE